jgi:hypothetical protein
LPTNASTVAKKKLALLLFEEVDEAASSASTWREDKVTRRRLSRGVLIARCICRTNKLDVNIFLLPSDEWDAMCSRR